jgi:peptide/nickel transport system ATP-binding protein
MRYTTTTGNVNALNGVNLNIYPEEVVGIVGESGCGKSTLGLSITKLIPSPPALFVGGSINYKGLDIMRVAPRMIKYVRGTEISMIFQEPLSSLNPVLSIGDQLSEAIDVRESRISSTIDHETFRSAIQNGSTANLRVKNRDHRSKELIEEEAIQALKLVRITDPERIYQRYPHELSGGMSQRVMIAMALSQKPSLLIADEPTSALDVTTQAEILKLIRDLIHEVHTSVLFITHDLALVGYIADRIAVMYAGEIVETAPTDELLSNPLHPYTQGLIASFPSGFKNSPKISPIPGVVPDLRNLPNGCKFHPRCPHAFAPCLEGSVGWTEVSPGHGVSCHLYGSKRASA